jgi:hypothetical protein
MTEQQHPIEEVNKDIPYYTAESNGHLIDISNVKSQIQTAFDNSKGRKVEMFKVEGGVKTRLDVKYNYVGESAIAGGFKAAQINQQKGFRAWMAYVGLPTADKAKSHPHLLHDTPLAKARRALKRAA